jgi:hypothetical protein
MISGTTWHGHHPEMCVAGYQQVTVASAALSEMEIASPITAAVATGQARVGLV